MSLGRRFVALTICASLLGSWAAQCADVNEYEVKAAYLYRFLPFVTWPDSALLGAGQPLVVAIVGDDPFGGVLENALRGKRLENRPIEIRHFPTFDDYQPSAVLFLSRSERARYQKILARLAGKPVLVVGEGEEFCHAGGAIGFLLVENKIRFAINQGAVRQGGLEISSKLMALAVACPPESNR